MRRRLDEAFVSKPFRAYTVESSWKWYVLEGRIGMQRVTAYLNYKADENIIYVTFPLVHLETQAEIRAHFDRVVDFWKANCRGKKVYFVVGYDGFSVNLRENDFYAQQMKRVVDCAITIVRYGGDALQRAGARLYNMKLHTPSRLYESREKALAIVKALQSGEMSVESG